MHLILDALERFDDNEIKLDVFGAGEDDYARECMKRIQTSPKAEFKNKQDPSMVVKKMREYEALVLASTV